MQRHLRHGPRRVAAQQSLGVERAQELGPLRGKAPEQCGDVDLGEDEADLALGPVEVERAAQDHDHPLGELDALLGQPVAQGRPGAAPTLHVERRHAATAPVAPGSVVLGVDQAHVEMARAVVRDVLDLAPDPEVALARKSLVERASRPRRRHRRSSGPRDGPPGRRPHRGRRADWRHRTSRTPYRCASRRVRQPSSQLLPDSSSGRKPMSCRGLPIATTARSRAARPKSATNLPSSNDPPVMWTSSFPPGFPSTCRRMPY